MKVEVNTHYDERVIIQRTEISYDEFDCNNMKHDYVDKIINLQEQGIKEALIKLGWTPPKD